jgi:hypothetical protein
VNNLKVQLRDTAVSDEAVIFTSIGATHVIDRLDGEKMGYGVGAIGSYTTASNKLLTYNAIEPFVAGRVDTIFLKTGLAANKSYELRFIGLASYTGTNVYLFDKLTGVLTDLVVTGAYAFSTSSAITPSFDPTRFYLLFGDSVSPLPVSLISFAATKSNNKAHLSWSTSSEKGSSHFIVERSIDASAFTEIAYVKSKGSSYARIDYSATDLHPDLTRINYYRLKQVDNDGRYEYSDLKSIRWNDQADADGGDGLSVYPNPAADKIVLTSKNKLHGAYDIRIYTMEGSQVKNIPSMETTGGEAEIMLSGLQHGMYFIQATGMDGRSLTAKFLVR